jgi:CDP-diacylglycerol--glycerol-3-phosphate 3-phosphatidyltransferase
MKNTANAISIGRILLTLLLIVFSLNITLFVILYILCGVSDFLDGYIARKTKTTSTIGARIDSAADIIWFISITAILVSQYGNELFACLPLLAATFLVRCFNAVFAAVKYIRLYFYIHGAINCQGFWSLSRRSRTWSGTAMLLSGRFA